MSGGPSLGLICGLVCTVAGLLTLLIIVAISLKALDQLNYGLNYDSVTLSIEDMVYTTAGLYWLGPGHWFITYPRTIQTIEFVAAENDRLQTRTSDGLPVSLSVSFQYRYDPVRLRDNYLTFKEAEVEVYENTAKSVIANAATNFSATTFFNDKQGIAEAMEERLTEVFDEQLFAHIEAFQITQVELPHAFQTAILETIQAKQNITQAGVYKENMLVTFNTQILVANETRKQTIAAAYGTAAQRAAQAEAIAGVVELTVGAEMYAYGNISSSVGLENNNNTLDYIWWSEQESLGGKEFLVGLDPQSYIRGS